MYYLYIIISVLMFGGCFIIKDIYRNIRKVSDVQMTFETLFSGSIAGLFVLLIINGFEFEITGFTVVMALLSVLNGLLYTYCSFKALKHINLSLFSLFSMLGGMLLPFFQGIIFYNEDFTIAKFFCVVFIFFALLLSVTKEKEKKKLNIYYIGIFLLNGMSGVLSKYFSEASFPKTSVANYSVWTTIFSIIISGIILLIIRKKEIKEKLTIKAGVLSTLSGVLDKVGNFLLVYALMFVDASIQYPMVTGGVMIVSTIGCYFLKRKPSKREIYSIILAFIGLIILFLF